MPIHILEHIPSFPNQVYLEGFLLVLFKTRQTNLPTPVPPVFLHWFPRHPKSELPFVVICCSVQIAFKTRDVFVFVFAYLM